MTDESIKISVIIPVYNKENELEECLNSIIKQTLNPIEIICINDGSTDNSINILKKYSELDQRIILINQNNKGPGSARNQGLKISKGEYIAFIDADDWIEETCLEELYNDAKKYSSDLVLFNAIEHLPESKTRERIYYHEDIDGIFNFKDKPDLVMNNFQIVCTKLHKLSFIKENQIKFSESGLFEDVYFHIKSTIKAEKISYLNKIFYNYRRTKTNSRQLKSIKSKDCFVFLDILKSIKTLLMKENVYELLETNYLEFKLTELNNLLNNIDEEHKEEFYELLKNDFKTDIITIDKLSKLSSDKSNFYLSIKNSKNFLKYVEEEKNSKKTMSFKNKVANSTMYFLNKIFDLV